MSSYHGWTHAPKALGGTDPILLTSNPYPALRLLRIGTTTLADSVADLGAIRLNFDSYTDENEAFLRRNSSDVGDPSPPDVDYIVLQLKGLYVMNASLTWLGIWGGERGISWRATGDETAMIENEPFQIMPHTSTHTVVGNEAHGLPFLVDEVDTTLELYITQRSGASRQISATASYWEIVYLGPTSIDDWAS